jgi:5-methylcytosine-specific restriction protein A
MPTINLGRRKKRERVFNKTLQQGFYQDRRWKKLRALKKKNNPLCELCLAAGRVRQMTEVHHIIPIDISNPDEDLIYDYGNLMSLCTECHQIIHSGLNPVERLIAIKREVR